MSFISSGQFGIRWRRSMLFTSGRFYIRKSGLKCPRVNINSENDMRREAKENECHYTNKKVLRFELISRKSKLLLRTSCLNHLRHRDFNTAKFSARFDGERSTLLIFKRFWRPSSNMTTSDGPIEEIGSVIILYSIGSIKIIITNNNITV